MKHIIVNNISDNKEDFLNLLREVFSINILIFLPTFWPLRLLMFLARFLNLGWPGNVASDGQNRLLVWLDFGSGRAGGSVNPGQPIRGNAVRENNISSGPRSSSTCSRLLFMLS